MGEWDAFSKMYDRKGAKGLAHVNQLVTELHFSTSLRFSLEKARFNVPKWTELAMGAGYYALNTRPNPGNFQDRDVLPELVKAGVKANSCCREYSFITRHEYMRLVTHTKQQWVWPGGQIDDKGEYHHSKTGAN